MNLLFKFAVLCSIGCFALYSMDNDATGVMSKASYFVYEGNEGNRPYVVMGVPTKSKRVTFYTYDGEAIITTGHQLDFKAVKSRLDSSAPKPQPIKYSIKYWECRIGFGYKGTPGYFIVFHDKHDNQIKSFRFEKDKTNVTEFSSELDLSLLSFDDIDSLYAASQEHVNNRKEKSNCSHQ